MLQIKTWHFISMFAVVVTGISILGSYELKDIPEPGNTGSINELHKDSFLSSISSGVTCVLFCNEDSGICKKMEYNLDKAQSGVNTNMKFYKMNSENCPGQYCPAVPSILIYKDGQEVKRITGMVPVSNLKMILNRLDNESTN